MANNPEMQDMLLEAALGMRIFDVVKDYVSANREKLLGASREVVYVCNTCGTEEEGHQPKSFLRCSRCKSVYYCNKVCQLKDWKQGGVPGSACRPLTHRQCCPEFAKDNIEFQNDSNGIVVRKTLFPWANQHHESGAFFMLDFLERRSLYGKIGFWARPETHKSYLSEDDSKGWCHGQMLLQKRLISIKDGFASLKKHEIPSGPPLKSPIHSWAEYIQQRNVDGSSIAPLLLTNVLTIYQMVYHQLKLHRKSPQHENDGFYVVYVVGAESELNSLPLLEELAYLLPGWKLELRFVSPAVKHLMEKATRSYPKSYLMTCGDYLIDKNVVDGGRIRVKLEGRYGLLQEAMHYFNPHSVPDAVIGLNAGIGSYSGWGSPVSTMILRGIPFCFSEFTKHSHRVHRDVSIPKWVTQRPGALYHPKMVKIELNPFHGVVSQHFTAVIIPAISNGYLLTFILRG